MNQLKLQIKIKNNKNRYFTIFFLYKVKLIKIIQKNKKEKINNKKSCKQLFTRILIINDNKNEIRKVFLENMIIIFQKYLKVIQR